MKVVYHIVLVPKYRRKAVYGKLRKDIRSNIEAVMRLQIRRDNRITRNAGPHTYVAVDTTEYMCVGIHGIPEG